MSSNWLAVQCAKVVFFAAICSSVLYIINSQYGCKGQDKSVISAAKQDLNELYKSQSLKKHIGKPETFKIDKTRDTKDSENKTKLIQELVQSLRMKLKDADPKKSMDKKLFLGCKAKNIDYDDEKCTADDGCLRKEIPEDLTERIEDILSSTQGRLRIPRDFWSVIEEMRAQLKTRQKVIIASAVSSSHYNEMQAMLQSFHETVFPTLKNFTLIMYDIGLKPWERPLLEQHCRCQVLTFPCDKLPGYFCNPLKSFAWKIFIIAAHLKQAEILWWADSSIRMDMASAIPEMLKRTRERGVQLKSGNHMYQVAYHTLPQMPVAFGDSPCMFTPIRMVEGGFGFYHNEPLVHHAVIKPLVACASHSDCLTPQDQETVQKCPRFRKKKTIGWCHRVDQSAMSIVLARLFREQYYHFAVGTSWFMMVTRGRNRPHYLTDLEAKARKEHPEVPF